MAILNNNPLIGSGGNQGYNINNSLRFRSSASAYLSRTPSVTGNQQKFTWSGWVKRGTLGSGYQAVFAARTGSSGTYAVFWIFNDTFSFQTSVGSSNITTTAVYRDPAAWYHIVIAVDTTQATAANRTILYVNGVQVTAFSTATYPTQNGNININSTATHLIGQQNSTQYFDGYMAEVNFVDGQQLTPSSFGETDTTTGVWKPKAYSGTYGTNGFYLKFSDIATTSGSNAGLGKDFSGNSNYWTTNNISVTSGTTYDAMTDSPTNTSATTANYAVLNPLDNNSMTLSAANLDAAGSTTYGAVRSSIAVSSGKYYFEVNVLQNVSGNFVGIAPITSVFNTTNIYANALAIDNSTIGGIKTVGVTIDFDNLECKFYVNNSLSSTQTIVAANAPYAPFVADGSSGNNASYSVNFGQRPFAYTPPTGFVALNTYNLPTPTILQGNKYMDATLYTGNGTSQNIVNTAGFKPDWVWVKSRSNAYSHYTADTIRGVNSILATNSTNGETTVASSITAFNSNGFSVGTEASTNGNAATFVGWQWQAGQGSTSSNTSGSITSTVSVNTTAGFSIVTYTGTGSSATVGHGLGVAPKMVIIKNRTAGSTAWNVYQASIPSGNLLSLNSTAASFANTNRITAVSSTTFSIGTDGDVNGSTNSHVAYCWAEIAGFSKFGSYTGNGSTDGPFVYTGFRPKFVMIKRTDSTENWQIVDSSRDIYNVAINTLFPNLSNAESGGVQYDLLSNGFKVKSSTGGGNTSGGTYIYMVFAEAPFKNSLAR
jgi:hypothetical protein